MKARSRLHRCRGITLLELVTVMGIVAIIMAIAVPSYKYVTNANRIAAEVNGLLGDMQYARAEAIKEGQAVTVCVSNDGATCAGGTVTTWHKGWIVFSDVSNDHSVDAGDAVLRVQSAFTGTDTFTASNNVGFVTFNREGFAMGPGIANGVLITLHALVPNSASTRCLSLSLVGLTTVQTYGQTTNNNNAMQCL